MPPSFRPDGPGIAIFDPSATGGITHYTFQLADALVRAGCRVTLITSADWELRALPRSFDVWYLFRPSRLRAWATAFRSRPQASAAAAAAQTEAQADSVGGASGLARSVLDVVRRLRLTAILGAAAVRLRLRGTRVVHVHWLLDRNAGLFFIRMLKRLGIRVVYTVHDVLPHDEESGAVREFFQSLYRHPDRLILHSQNNRRELLDLCPVEPGQIEVIPHGRHGIFFERSTVSRTDARARLEIPSQAQVILFFGLIKRYKGLEHLLAAFDLISARCPDALLLVAGRIPDNDPESRLHYGPILERCSSRPNIRFTKAYVPFDRVADFFLAADLVVLPYSRASQSGVLLTAYAAGRPVIATDVGGLGEVVREGASGFVVPPRNPEALAAAAVTLLENEALREQFGREALRLAETTYAWTTIAADTLEVYRSALELRDAAEREARVA